MLAVAVVSNCGTNRKGVAMSFHLVIIDKEAPSSISATKARKLWAARVVERRRGHYLAPCCDSYEWSDGLIVREYAEIRLGSLGGPSALYLEGVPRKRRPGRVQHKSNYFRVRRSGLFLGGCVEMVDDFAQAWACLIETAKEYEQKGGCK